MTAAAKTTRSSITMIKNTSRLRFVSLLMLRQIHGVQIRTVKSVFHPWLNYATPFNLKSVTPI
jgi:hypothetical protein